MTDRKYKVYLDGVYFDSLYETDYYNDKPNFFAHGARQFFTIYQISRSADFQFKIVEEISGEVFEFKDCLEFKIWVEKNYKSLKDCLDQFYWNKNPDSKLK